MKAKVLEARRCASSVTSTQGDTDDENGDLAGGGSVRAGPGSGPYDRLDGTGHAETGAADLPPVNPLVEIYELAHRDPSVAAARLREALLSGRLSDEFLLSCLDMIDELRKRNP